MSKGHVMSKFKLFRLGCFENALQEVNILSENVEKNYKMHQLSGGVDKRAYLRAT